MKKVGVIGDGQRLLVAMLAQAGVLSPVRLPAPRSVRWTQPHQGEQEKARRRRQIAKGMRQAWTPKESAAI